MGWGPGLAGPGSLSPLPTLPASVGQGQGVRPGGELCRKREEDMHSETVYLSAHPPLPSPFICSAPTPTRQQEGREEMPQVAKRLVSRWTSAWAPPHAAAPRGSCSTPTPGGLSETMTPLNPKQAPVRTALLSPPCPEWVTEAQGGMTPQCPRVSDQQSTTVTQAPILSLDS